MIRHGKPQFGKARHGGILIIAIEHGVGGGLANIERPRAIWKALAQIDRAGLPRKAGHDLKDRCRHLVVDRVHSAS